MFCFKGTIHTIDLILWCYIHSGHLISVNDDNLPQVSEMHFFSYYVSHLNCAMCQTMLILYKFYLHHLLIFLSHFFIYVKETMIRIFNKSA